MDKHNKRMNELLRQAAGLEETPQAAPPVAKGNAGSGTGGGGIPVLPVNMNAVLREAAGYDY